MISADRRWIFVHIQKTGGSAVRAALGVEIDDPHKHFLARELRVLYGDAAWQGCFKFAFVRNPWDRLVSWWSMINANRTALSNGMPLNRFHRFVLQRATTFEEFLLSCDEEVVEDDGCKWIYRNQLEYLTDSTGKLLVDFVGRFETLEQDFASVAQRIPLSPTQLPHVNRSHHGQYVEYYTPALAQKVGLRYRRDIETFGYVFGK